MNIVERFVIGVKDAGKLKKSLLCILSAFLFALPFMTKSMAGDIASLSAVFGWTGLVIPFMLLFDFKKTLKRVLCSLFCFFYVFYFFAYSWFVSLYPLDFAGFGKLESIGVILIPVTLIPLIHASVMTFWFSIGFVSAKNVKSSILRAVLVSFGYVLGEYFQSVGTFAFPWTRLFVGQTSFISLLQSASLFGSYFITFIMVLVNALVAFSLLNFKDNRKKSLALLFVAVLVFVTNLVFGLVRIEAFDYNDHKKLEAVVLQGNIPSGVKWTGKVNEREIYLELSDSEALKGINADIVVMPETAFPVTLSPYDGFDNANEKTLMQISEKLSSEVFVGAFNNEEDKAYNSVFVYDSDGAVTRPYNKHNIVPFGEFLPYKSIIEKLLPVLAEINMLSNDLERGENFMPLETKSGKAACLVCFDSIFPDTLRKQVKNGAEFVVIVTNDSWYKTSSAIYQHADHAVMRAIENNRPVIRSANTGISRIIDSFGRVKAQTKVDERTAISHDIALSHGCTIYTIIGDVFVLVGAIFIIVCLAVTLLKKKILP